MAAVVVVVADSAAAAVVAADSVTTIAGAVADNRSAHALIAALDPEPGPEPQRPEAAQIAISAENAALAHAIGESWAQTYVRALQLQERDIVGAWPGTLREARRKVLARLPKLGPDQLDQLARLANLAARRGWETVSEPDLES